MKNIFVNSEAFHQMLKMTYLMTIKMCESDSVLHSNFLTSDRVGIMKR